MPLAKYAHRFFKFSAFVIAAFLIFLSHHAYAQIDADFSRYCRENFPGSQYEKTEVSSGIQHNCNNQGTRLGIDLSEACRLTTGSDDFRELGARVICSETAQDNEANNGEDSGPVDISSYCRENFPNSIPEEKPEPTGIRHYCRQPGATGGFALQAVDYRLACMQQKNTPNYIQAGRQILCAGAGIAGRPNNGDAGGGGGPGSGFPPLKPEDIVDAEGNGEIFGQNVKYANLQECGNGDPEYSMRLPFGSMKRGLGEQTFDFMGLTMACPGLTGGKTVDFQEACNTFSGAAPPMTARLLPWGVPTCWPDNRKWGPPKLGEAGWGINSAPLTGVCYEAYFGRPPSRDEQLKIATLLKYMAQSLKVECFYMNREALMKISQGG